MDLQCELAVSAGPGDPIPAGDVEHADQLFRKHGALVLPNSFDRATIKTLGTAFAADYGETPAHIRDETCLQVGDKRFMFTVAIEGAFADPAIYASPVVLPIVKQLLGDDAVLQSCGAVCAFPGAEVQHVHRDFPELFPSVTGLGMMLPPYALHVVIPLTDLDTATGTTALWEGSHRLEHRDRGRGAARVKTDVDFSEAALPYAQMGDCYFMDYRLRHAGTPNISDQARTILYLVYSRPWFKDRTNYSLQAPVSIDADNLKAVPAEFASLFGAVRNG